MVRDDSCVLIFIHRDREEKGKISASRRCRCETSMAQDEIDVMDLRREVLPWIWQTLKS